MNNYKIPRNYQTLKSDLSMGRRNENKLLKWLNDKLPEEKHFQLFKNKFSTFDFVNEDCIYELKSRRVRCMKYHDTMIGYNKISTCLEGHKDHCSGVEYKFFFLFTDGLYSWEFQEGDYEVRNFFHADKQDFVEYAYIPVSKLKLEDPNLNSWN